MMKATQGRCCRSLFRRLFDVTVAICLSLGTAVTAVLAGIMAYRYIAYTLAPLLLGGPVSLTQRIICALLGLAVAVQAGMFVLYVGIHLMYWHERHLAVRYGFPILR
jgi:hypothetical protein